MHTRIALVIATTVNVAQGADWPVWNKRQEDYGYVTSTPEVSAYVTSVETICTSTDTITLPPETISYGCPTIVTASEPCTSTITYSATTMTKDCPYETVVSKYCPGAPCVTTLTATSQCEEVVPSSVSESLYYCQDEISSDVPCETVTTPVSTSLSTYPCTTTVTSSTTIYKKITITDTRTLTDTLTVPSPTTTTDVVLVPTTYISTVTEDGTTREIMVTSTITQTQDVYVPTTIATTILSTATRDGTTQIVTIATTDKETVLVTLAPSTVTLPVSTVTQPARTIVTTLTISGTITTSTVIQPASTVIVPPSIITVSASTITSTAIPPAPPMTSAASPAPTSAVPTPAAPEPPACYISGPTPTADAAGCDGRSCAITFDERAYVHWEVFPDSPALVTRVTFEYPEKRQTCITTSCNTELFSSFYYTSLASCAFPPCPSNSINADCNIVVGPIGFPNGGGTTSVTQMGPSGWNINLGPTATARNIGRCGPSGTECITSAPSVLPSSLAYTGSVTSTSVFNTELGTSVLNYLLPQLPDYFPAGDVYGDCTTATLATPTPRSEMLQARQNDQEPLVETTGNSKVNPWKGVPTFTGDSTVRFEGNRVVSTVTATALPNELPSDAEPRPSVTEAAGSPTAVPQASDSASPVDQAPSSADSVPPANSAPGASTALGGSPMTIITPPAGTPQTPAPDNAAPSQTAPLADSTVVDGGGTPLGVSTATGSAVGTGSVTITETVYYSMLAAPAEEESQISALESLRSGISTATGDLESFVCGVVGCSSTGTGSGTGTGSANATAQATGAAGKRRGLEGGWMDVLPILPVLVGVLG